MTDINFDMEDAKICIDMCMQLGAPHGKFEGDLQKGFPSSIRLEEGPLKLLQDMWRKYYLTNTKKHEEVGIDVAQAEANLKASKDSS
tara:strand:- start:263 stop:523 length:261 start_codon:yes stop_codon:yes gene_type:complete